MVLSASRSPAQAGRVCLPVCHQVCAIRPTLCSGCGPLRKLPSRHWPPGKRPDADAGRGKWLAEMLVKYYLQPSQLAFACSAYHFFIIGAGKPPPLHSRLMICTLLT